MADLYDNRTGDGSRVGLFLGVPEVLGAQRASLAPYDDSPPHVTFLVIGDVRGREGALLGLLRECVARHPAACWAVLDRLNVAKNTEGRTVAFQDVRFSGGSFSDGGSWALAGLRCEIVRALRAASFPLKDHSPDDWRAHFTRAYLPDGAEVYAEPRIEGAFEVARLEVWGLPEVVFVPLAPLATEQGDSYAAPSLAKSLLGIFAPPSPRAALPLPVWMGALLSRALTKGRAHKYLRKIPTGKSGKSGKPLYRYYYTVTGGHGLGHEKEIVQGAAFRIKSAGKEGHFHVEAVDGDRVTIKHDESGKVQRMSKIALAGMLYAEHAEAMTDAKSRAHKTLEEARKTGGKRQVERAEQHAAKFGPVPQVPVTPTKEESKGASTGQGAYQFEPLSVDDFKGLWKRTDNKMERRQDAADQFNKLMGDLSKQLHEAFPDDAQAKQEFDRYGKQLKAAWFKWADRDGVLADLLHPSSVYDTRHKRELAFNAQSERLALMQEAKKILPRLQRAEQKSAKEADPMAHAKNAVKEAQDKLDRLTGLNDTLKTVANPEARAKRFTELGLTDAEVREYGRSGVPTATLKYLKQRVRDADRRVDDLEYEQTLAQRRAQGLNKSRRRASLAAELADLF